MTRRGFVVSTAAVAAAQTQPIPIIDTHIHLFDTTRPQGVPYPSKSNPAMYRPALPDRFRAVAAPLGVVGAIEVEASPWIEDNLWVLETCQKDPIMVGMIGNLEPGKPEFAEYLERYHRNPLFLGIRYGNLWGRNLVAEVGKPEFIAGMKAVADAGLTLDTANPRPDLIEALVRLTDRVPTLRVVIDHLPQMPAPTDASVKQAYESNLRQLGKRPQVYVKISEVIREVNGAYPTDLARYRPGLDLLWDVFGVDHLLFASDWPNSAGNWAPYADCLRLTQEYFQAKGREAAANFFWRNSIDAYRWIKRDPKQPQLRG